jgi:hypothetical protein
VCLGCVCCSLYCSKAHGFQLNRNKELEKKSGHLCGGSEVCDSAEIGKVVCLLLMRV